MESAKRGNKKAFASLVERYEQAMYCTAYNIAGSSWDAFDIVQDTFLEAFLKLRGLRDNAKFKAWLTRILVNKCYQELRGKRRMVVTERIPEQPDSQFAGFEDRLDLLKAIGRLEPEYRLIIGLRYFQDLKVEEIADILELPAGTVKSRINRALKKLRVHLGITGHLEVIK